MAFKVQLSEAARTDMKQTTALISKRAPASADKWFDGLIDALKSLTEMPLRFALMPEANELKRPLRSFPYHSHRVIYQVDEPAQVVSILRVYHSARAPLQLEDLG